MKYKVGDRVRIVSKWNSGCRENSEGKMDKYLGTVMTIREVDISGSNHHYHMVEDRGEHTGSGWVWYESAIACLVSRAPITKKDLKTGDVVKQRDGLVQIYIKEFDVFVCKNGWNDAGKLRDNLEHCHSSKFDIIEVRRPHEKSDCVFSAFDDCYGELVYDRERDSVVEMTLSEICAALGKTIKIVKG